MSSVPATPSAGGHNTGLIILISCVATIGGLLFGYDSGAVNGTQPGLKSAFALDDAGMGFTVGSLLIGCFVGAFFEHLAVGKHGLAQLLGRPRQEELGLDHFEGRSWTGLHRHALLTMIAYTFLQSRRLAQAGREKKNRRPTATAEPAGSPASHP